MRRIPSLAVALLAVVVVASTPALAATNAAKQSWTQVTDPDSLPSDEVGVARTKDGVLHVLWRVRTGPDQEFIRHAPISTSGTIGVITPATQSWYALGNPAVVVQDDGTLRMFVAGETGSAGGRDGMQTATADADGRTWTTYRLRVSSTNSVMTDGAGAAVSRDGDPSFAFALPDLVGFHEGINPAQSDVQLATGGECCVLDPQVAFDKDGRGYVAWFSTVEGSQGTYVEQVTPRVGRQLLAPQSAKSGKAVAAKQRTPLVARVGGGVYVAYCSGYPKCTRVMLWKVGAGQPVEIAKGGDVRAVTAAAAPDGRMWVVWADASEGTILAARTSTSGGTGDAPITISPPAGTTETLKLTADATKQSVDVLAAVSVRTPSGATETATWHTKVTPGQQG